VLPTAGRSAETEAGSTIAIFASPVLPTMMAAGKLGDCNANE
jgi:hypothetical protein